METFFCDEDYQEYLSLLGHWCGEFDVRIWSYCLMPNPVHLILVPQTAEGLGGRLARLTGGTRGGSIFASVGEGICGRGGSRRS